MNKLITITITDGENEYATNFIIENVNSFQEAVEQIETDLDICLSIRRLNNGYKQQLF